MWYYIPHNERYKLINARVFLEDRFFHGNCDERFDVKVALKVKREQFIRTRGLRKVSSSCKFVLDLFCWFVIDLF